MRAEPQAEWKSPQAWERISTSLGAILHKPDLPGPPTRHASSRRLFRLPTRLFRLPLPTFRDPPTDFLEAGIWETVHPIREATQVCRIVSESARSQVEFQFKYNE